MNTNEIQNLSSDILYKLDIAQSKVINSKQAQEIFKKFVDVDTAIVNVLSNTGIAGFKFHVPQTEQVKMENEVTDYYINTGTAVQDHIAQKPVTITLTGLQGEYFYSVNQIEDMLAKVVPTMSLIKQFLPKLTRANIQNRFKKVTAKELSGNVQNEKIVAGIEKKGFNAVNLFRVFQDLYKLKTAQTRAFLYFEAMWKSRALFTVETSWKRYDNMVIQSLVPKRDNNADITDFSITFKQVNLVESKAETIENYVSRHAQQMSKTVDKGVDKGQKVDTLSPKGN